MHKEEIQTGASPRVIRRLLGFARPYWPLMVVAVLGLGIGTAAELSLPLLIQRAIDQYILPRHVLVEQGGVRRFIPAGSTEAPAAAQGGIWLGISLDGLDPESLVPEARALVDQAPRDGKRLYLEEEAYARLDADARRVLRGRDLAALTSLAWVFTGLLILSVLGSFLQIFTTALTGQRVMKDLRRAILAKTMRQSLGFLQNNPVGKLVTRITSDVETVNELFTSVLTAFVKDISVMAGVLVVLFSLNPTLAAVSLLSMVPVLLLLLGFRSWYQKAYRTSRTMVSRMNTFLSEYLSGMSLIQVFVRQGPVLRRFSRENEDLKRASLGEMYVFAVFRPLVDLMASLGTALILWFGARQLLEGFISLGLLVAFVNLLQRFFEPVLDISDKFNILQSAMAGGERALGLLDEDWHLQDQGKVILGPIRGDLEFRSVDFAYKADEPVLRKLSFRAEAGEKIAIVGYTGAGKTTIASVLTRLWDVQGGDITIDGIPIRDLPLKTLRTLVQPIQQDAFLFSDTVRYNICLGKAVDDEQVWEALRRVEAEEVVKSLPQGLNTEINEGATKLSAGQKQLINFARILVQNPQILIMDEASANIDTETERRIQHAMKEVTRGRTSLVIAHRLSTIRDAHRILVLANGAVAESGTHDDLMARDGQYAYLYRLQFGEGAHQVPGP